VTIDETGRRVENEVVTVAMTMPCGSLGLPLFLRSPRWIYNKYSRRTTFSWFEAEFLSSHAPLGYVRKQVTKK